MPQFPPHKDDRGHKGDGIRHRPCEHDAVQPEKDREYQEQGDEEDDLSCHGQEQALHRLSDSSKEVGRYKLHAVCDDHEQENTHEAHRKGKIQLIPCPKEGDDLPGEKLEQDKSHRGDSQVDADRQLVGAAHPVILFCPVVEADDRLAPLGYPYDKRQQDGVCLHDDPAGCQRDVRPVGGGGSVIGQGIVQHDLHKCDSHLVQAVAHTQRGCCQALPGDKAYILSLQFNVLKFPYIPHSGHKGADLTDDRGPGSACHAPVKSKDEQRVQDGVDHGPYEHACHGIFGAAVRPGQVAHAVGHDEEGHAQRSDPCIVYGVGHHICRGPEGKQKGMQEQLYQHRINDSEDHHHADAVPHHPARFVLLPRPQVEGETRGAADTDEKSDGKTDRGERIGHIGGRISQITNPLSYEDLVHDIVEGAHHHCDDAGDGKAPQKLRYALVSQRIFLCMYCFVHSVSFLLVCVILPYSRLHFPRPGSPCCLPLLCPWK